jgi:hypothetical protein
MPGDDTLLVVVGEAGGGDLYYYLDATRCRLDTAVKQNE